MDFLEERRLCAPTQTGFRPQMSINHHLLALQHIIDRRIHRPARSQRKLYCCFVDLTGAYDCVQRPLMWEALRRYGVHGRMLAAFQSLYADAHITMKFAGRVGSSLPSLVEGCPGSPTLFGCTVDGLPAYLDARAPDAGILIQVGDDGELLVSHLMYADDIVLLGDSPADLQQLLDALAGFCAALGLDVESQRHSPRRIGNCLRFRLGCSTLPVVMCRHDSTPRHLRHCQQCGTAAVGDERHLVFECPAVQHIRDYHSDLFWDGQSMREFVNQTDQAAVMD